MTRRRTVVLAAYWLAVLAIACTAVVAADLLPIHNPYTAWFADAFAGNVAGLAALTYLPCPCHRKDRAGRGASEIKHPSMARTRAHFAADPLPSQQDRRSA